ncbi:MAG TPA: cyclase family protein, partial [Chloroflexota bacterium]|nr:cyclase family protein [Chloroflexota bacterium]
MNFSYTRVVDLTLPIVPGQGGRPFTIERHRTEELTPHVPVDHPWYIMHKVATISHIGTHLEAPYHCFPDGRDLGSIPIEQLVGEAVVLDLSRLPEDSLVGTAELGQCIETAGGVRRGDIVLLRTGYADRRDTPAFAR